jgi:hypothetical protein
VLKSCLTPLSTIFKLYRGVLLVDETGRPGENHRPVASHWHILLNDVVSFEYTSAWARFKLTTLMVIGTDCTGSCKSNYAIRPRRSLRDEKSNNSQYHMKTIGENFAFLSVCWSSNGLCIFFWNLIIVWS